MGLDIHAASHLRHIGPIPESDELDRLDVELDAQGKSLYDVYFLLHGNSPDWDDHLRGMEPGLYEYTEASQQHEFRAGSYSGYNEWRRQLSLLALGIEPEDVWADPEDYAGQPFVELIHFTDCDGRIGTQVAARLANDFRAHANRITLEAAKLEEGEWFLRTYRDFARAFDLAAEQGALRFC